MSRIIFLQLGFVPIGLDSFNLGGSIRNDMTLSHIQIEEETTLSGTDKRIRALTEIAHLEGKDVLSGLQ